MASTSSKQLAKRALDLLQQHADAEAAQNLQRFFKSHERIKAFGIKTQKLREINRQLYGDIKKEWALSDAVQFCDRLITEPYIESKILGIFLLEKFKRGFEPSTFQSVHSWLQDNQCDNWAVTDTMSTLILTPLIRNFPELLSEIRNWAHSENLWVRRSSAVCLTPLARKGEHLEMAYEIAASLFSNEEDLIHKATGWLLREAGKTDRPRLESYLLERGPRIPRTALRYAIEKFPAAKRKEILQRTKS